MNISKTEYIVASGDLNRKIRKTGVVINRVQVNKYLGA